MPVDLKIEAEDRSQCAGDSVDMKLLTAFEVLQPDDGSDLIVELIDLYLGEAAQRVSQIRETAIATEWVVLRRAAHNLKGSSSNLGVRRVAEICQKLEWMDRHDSPETIADLVRQLDCEFARASASLAAVRQRRLS